MSLVGQEPESPRAEDEDAALRSGTSGGRRLRPFARLTTVPWWLWLVAGLALVSFARVVTGVQELDSAGTLNEAVLATVPIALAGLAGIWSERAGVVNIGLEGMMILGCVGGAYFGFYYGPWAGVVGAIVFGMVGGLIHAVATVTFGVDHIVSGVALNIIAAGAASFLADTWFSILTEEGGGPNQSPPLDPVQSITIGPVADAAKSLESRHWFLVSDVGSIVRAVTESLSLLTVLAVVLVVGTRWLLWRTAFGLRLRSCGESPEAAETLGVPVVRYKFLAVLVSGAIAGLAGGFIVLVSAGLYQDGITQGKGYIGLAAMIFGNWNPGGMVLGASLFGYTDALQLRAGGDAVHSLLIVVGLVLLAVSFRLLRGGSRRAALTTLLAAVLVGAWFFLSSVVPDDFTRMTPYVATLFVLAFASQRLRMPAADGQVYRKGSAG